MLKVGTVCSGIGSPEFALEDLAIPHRRVFACEIDKYAQKSYLANFNVDNMFTDMTKDDWTEHYCDLLIGGIPCQAFSLAGKRLGELDPRGLLFYNFYNYLKKQQPKYFIIENVKGLLSDSGGKTFDNWLQLLSQSVNTHYNMFPHEDSLLYNVHWTVLNSKDFDVPQNRERVFIIGIRNDLPNNFRFPTGVPLTKRLKDVLESVVDEKYYLSDTMLEWLQSHSDKKQLEGAGFKFSTRDVNGIGSAINARTFKMGIDDNYIEEPKINVVGNVGNGHEAQNVYDKNGLAPCVREMHGKVTKIIVSEPAILSQKRTDFGRLTRKDYESGKLKLDRKSIQELVPREDGISNTITSVQKDNLLIEPKLEFIAGIKTGKLWLDNGKNLSRNFKSGNRIYDEKGISPALTSEGGGLGGKSGLIKVDSEQPGNVGGGLIN